VTFGDAAFGKSIRSHGKAGPVFVRLTRKLAETLDGVDVSRAHVGDLIEVSHVEAVALIAEGWAESTDNQSAPSINLVTFPMKATSS
jgi:hypothetical protein